MGEGKERPILFSGPMVRAIIDGRKTQTRRLVRPQPSKWIDRYSRAASDQHWIPSGAFIKDLSGFFGRGALEVRQNEISVRCPFGTVGDRLWVRETWHPDKSCKGPASYRATWPISDESPDDGWRPSIHMPRWASRITLEITDVRVERLNDISEGDAKAEGCNGGHDSIPGYQFSATPKEQFLHLWESINGPGSWEKNPWVWVIAFRKL